MSGGCIEHAGILDENKELTENAKAKILDRIKKSVEEGFAVASPFPCAAGKSIPIAKGFLPEDIEDETKYPEFHENIFKTYVKIAKGFNIDSPPNLPFPFCDPSAVATSLGENPAEFSIKDLPTLTPVSLALTINAKVPQQIPDIMSAFNVPPKLPIPNFELPKLDTTINLPPGVVPPGLDLSAGSFSQKFEFDSWALKVPEVFLKFTGDLISNVDLGGIVDLATGKPCIIIDKLSEAKIFGPSEGGDIVKQVVVADLVTFAGQCASIAAVAGTIGTSPAGATGGLGTIYGYKEATKTEGTGRHVRARNVIIDTYKAMFGKTPSLKEAQFLQAVASLENGYGEAFVLAKIVIENGVKRLITWDNPHSKGCNNWGNIHGSGDAGSFPGNDFKSDNTPYPVQFAKFSTPVAGCRRLLSSILNTRPYILKSLELSDYAWNGIFLMSMRSIYGSNELKHENNPNLPPASDAVNPTGIVYYVAKPEAYFDRFLTALEAINKQIGESPALDLKPPPKGYKKIVQGEATYPYRNNTLIGITMDQINQALSGKPAESKPEDKKVTE